MSRKPFLAEDKTAEPQFDDDGSVSFAEQQRSCHVDIAGVGKADVRDELIAAMVNGAGFGLCHRGALRKAVVGRKNMISVGFIDRHTSKQ